VISGGLKQPRYGCSIAPGNRPAWTRRGLLARRFGYAGGRQGPALPREERRGKGRRQICLLDRREGADGLYAVAAEDLDVQRTLWVLAVTSAALVGVAGAMRPASAETIYVTNEKGNTVSVIDGQSLEVVKTIPVGNRPRGFVMSLDYKTLYICASDS